MYFTFQQEMADELWTAVSKNYESENYSGAILDGIFLISKVIRDKTDIDLDGVALVGKIFGGNEPILKINKFRTETEKNEQKGFENILRGIFQGIRNPRAHEKITDDKQTCDSVLLFLNYLLSIINRSKSKFDINDFCQRVFDDDFVESKEYSELLCKEIPNGKYYEVLLEILNRRENAEPSKYFFIVNSLFSKLSEEQQDEILSYVNDILKTSDDNIDFRLFTTVFQKEKWENIDAGARMRAENKLIKSMEKGEFNSHKNKCTDGSLGTWLTNISDNLKLKSEFRRTILKKINSDKYEEVEYLLKYFKNDIILQDAEPEELLINAINKGLRKGDRRIYDLVNLDMSFSDYKWLEKIRESFDNFKEKKLYDIPEDLPF